MSVPRTLLRVRVSADMLEGVGITLEGLGYGLRVSMGLQGLGLPRDIAEGPRGSRVASLRCAERERERALLGIDIIHNGGSRCS